MTTIDKNYVSTLIRTMVAGNHGRYHSKSDAISNLDLGMSMLSGLNTEQLTAVFGIICGCPCGVSILSGAPGTGKSFVVKKLIEFCNLLLDVEIRIVAQLGISAAMHKGGVTLNSAMGMGKTASNYFPPVHGALGKGQKSITSVYSKFKGNGWGVTKPILTIVEEFSQTPSTSLTFLYMLLKRMEVDKLGLRDLLLVGDPKQMQPIDNDGSAPPAWTDPTWMLNHLNKEVTYPSVINLEGRDPTISSLDSRETIPYAPQCLYLTTVVRSADDLPLTSAMATLGHGRIFQNDPTDIIKDRVWYSTNGGSILGTPFLDTSTRSGQEKANVITSNYGGRIATVQSRYEECKKQWDKVVVLMPYNVHVRTWSNYMAELARAQGAKFKSYSTKINYRGRKGYVKSCDADLTNLVLENDKVLSSAEAKFVFSSTRVPPIIELYEGQPVICSKNLNEHLSNGTLCTVVSLLDNSIAVSINGKIVEVGYHPSTLDDEAGFIEQIPFSPGNAITIDRTQGMTFNSKDTAVIVYLPPDKYMSEWFKTSKPAGIYQALSRVEKLDQLYIISTYQMLTDCTSACATAISYADELKARSVLAGFTDYQNAKIGNFIKLDDVQLTHVNNIALDKAKCEDLENKMGVLNIPANSQMMVFTSTSLTIGAVVSNFKLIATVINGKDIDYIHPEHGDKTGSYGYEHKIRPYVVKDKPEEDVVPQEDKVWRDRERVFYGTTAEYESVPIIYCPQVHIDNSANFTMNVSGVTLIPSTQATMCDGYVKWVGVEFFLLEIISWHDFMLLGYEAQRTLLTQVKFVAFNTDPNRTVAGMEAVTNPPTSTPTNETKTGLSQGVVHKGLDLLTVSKGVIVHQVNTQKKMGAGLAHALSTAYPVVKKEYIAKASWKLGDVIFSKVTDDLYVASAAAQVNVGTSERQTDYDALRECLVKVREKAEELGLPIYLPYWLGSDLAGGKLIVDKEETWTNVLQIIKDELPNCTICYKIVGKPVQMVYPLKMHGEPNPLPVSTTIDAMRGYGRTHTTRSFEFYSSYGFKLNDLAIAYSGNKQVLFRVGRQYQITNAMIADPAYRKKWADAEKHSEMELDTFINKTTWGLEMYPLGDFVDGHVVNFPLPEKPVHEYKWAQFAPAGTEGYEVSSTGDARFSAVNAKLRDGRTIEQAYQLDVKGYRKSPTDTNWKAGKGKRAINGKDQNQLYVEYKALWVQWATENPTLIRELAVKAEGKVLTDKYASTPISQARALAEILTEM